MIITRKHKYVSNRRYKFVIDPHTNEAVGITVYYVDMPTRKTPSKRKVWTAPKRWERELVKV